MKITLAQLNPIIGDLKGNANKIQFECQKAINRNSNVIITPELSLWGYPPKDMLLDKNILKDQNSILEKLSKSN